MATWRSTWRSLSNSSRNAPAARFDSTLSVASGSPRCAVRQRSKYGQTSRRRLSGGWTFEGRRHYTAFLTNRQLYRYLAALGGGRYPSSRASRGTNPGFPGSRERPRQSDATARTSIWREPRSDTTGDPDGAVRRRTPAYRAGCFCLWWKK